MRKDGGKDLKEMSITELNGLSAKLREDIISIVDKKGGHLSSNLGAVELTVALHRCLSLPEDKLLFDVGHQCYAHKLLSERSEEMSRFRERDGASGFCDPVESEFDAYGSGHAGSTVAAAYGMCLARDERGSDEKIVCVVGDGALASGESLEAVNALSGYEGQLLIVINDNGMAISAGKGGLYRHFSALTIKRGYGKTKLRWKRILSKNALGRGIMKCLSGVKHFIKRVTGGDNFFEEMGVKYIGPLNGHDFKPLLRVFGNALSYKRPLVVHVKTVKGKGSPLAENDPEFYHGVCAGLDKSVNTFSEALGETLGELNGKFGNITAVTAAMEEGTGLKAFRERGGKVVDVGICEQTAVSLAAGMAISGSRPAVCVYSTFLQRAFDQIQQEVCLYGLPVAFFIDRAGFVGADGKTHQGLFDIAYMRLLGMTILAPSSVKELKLAAEYAFSHDIPVAVRYCNGDLSVWEGAEAVDNAPSHPIDRWQLLKEGKDGVFLAVGPRCVSVALRAAEISGKSVAVYNCTSVNPVDEGVLSFIGSKAIVTVEEGTVYGGFGSAVAEFYARNNSLADIRKTASPVWGGRRLVMLGAENLSVGHDSVAGQMIDEGLSPENLAKQMVELIKKR